MILGLGVGIVQTASPSYVVEMAPPQVRVFFRRMLGSFRTSQQWRGRLTGLFNSQ